MRRVKGYVVLAILLLVPSIGYFQKQYFLNTLKPGLETRVREVLEAEGVVNPVVHLDYFDVVMKGRVASDGQRARVAARVAALPGVRVTAEGNLLRSRGWLRIGRRDGRFLVSGVVTEDLDVRLPEPLEMTAGWDAALERRGTVEDPVGLEGWGGFLRSYFAEPGNRSVELRGSGLVMRGDATAGLRSDWLARASEVVDKGRILDEFTLQPTTYHFPGYRPQSLTDVVVLRQVERQLNANTVIFQAGSEELTSGNRDKVILTARAIITAGRQGRYVVGGHPARDGNATLNSQKARRRAEAVVKILVDHGVSAGQLEIIPFGISPGGNRDDQVEIVVR